MIQLSHPYMTTKKSIALMRQNFVSKVMFLLLNKLSRSVIAILPRSKHLLISWLLSPSAVILEPPKIKSLTISTVSPSICHEVMGPDTMILVFWMLSFKPTFSKNMHLQTNVFTLEVRKLSILIFKSDKGSIFSVLALNSGSSKQNALKTNMDRLK